jgi:hypothetical protein
MQLLLRLPWNRFLALVFFWVSIKTLFLFVVLRPVPSGEPLRRMLTLREINWLVLGNFSLLLITGGLMVLLDRSLALGIASALVFYAIEYGGLSKRFGWHPFAAG